MFKAVITCPATGKKIDTGLTFGDKATFENPTNKFTGNSVRCPHCGNDHTWNKDGAALVEVS
jgi:hypothetical protein